MANVQIQPANDITDGIIFLLDGIKSLKKITTFSLGRNYSLILEMMK